MGLQNPDSPVQIWVSPPKKPRSSERGFFYPLRKHGISPRVSVYIIKGGKPPLYLITLLGVHQKNFRNDDIQNFVLMIYNSCGIDDIQRQAVDFPPLLCYNT